jgi:hypothetical protein
MPRILFSINVRNCSMPMMCLLWMLILCGTDMIMFYFSELMSKSVMMPHNLSICPCLGYYFQYF